MSINVYDYYNITMSYSYPFIYLIYGVFDYMPKECVKIKELIENFDDLVDKINNCDEIKSATYITDGGDENRHDLVRSCIRLANSIFITLNGNVNYSTLNKTRHKVRVGESDSCGPLSMVIHTSKGKIVFG